MKNLMRRIKRIYRFIFEFILYNLKGILRSLSLPWNENYQVLAKLRNCHQGKRCFIVATGPSLKISDLEKLENEYTFSVNSIFLATQKTNWRSTYYLCLDERHFENMLDKYPKEINDVCTSFKFFNIATKKKMKSKDVIVDKALFIPVSKINRLNYLNNNDKEHFYFRTDLVQGIYNSGTVTNSAIILAIYMGFKEIYLLGTDCNYSDKIKHVGEDWNDKTMTISEQELIELRMKNGFDEISKVVDKYGVKVYNATRGGMLESFPRIDFEQINF